MRKVYCDRCKKEIGASEKVELYSLENYSVSRQRIAFEICEKCEEEMQLTKFIKENRGKAKDETEKDVKDRLFEVVEEIVRSVQE